jgi:hypothetical protein
MRRYIFALAFVVAACGQAGAPGGDAAASGGGEAAYVAACVAELTAENPQAATWAPDECASRWQRVVASGPLAEAVLAAAGGAAPASGSLGGDIEVGTEGRTATFSWTEVGMPIPYDVAGALQERGATVAMIGCSQVGTGEFNKAYSVTPRGGSPFQLSIYEREAPTANAWAFYNLGVPIGGGGLQTLAQLRGDGMEWTERCAY